MTTASQVQLGSSVVFSAVPGNSDAVLGAGAPSAFDFLKPSPAAVTVNGAALAVPTGKSLLVAGGSLTINSAGGLTAPAGQIGVITVSVPTTVSFDPVTLLPAPVAASGPTTLTDDAQLSADGNGGGTISIQCGDLTVSGGAAIHADTLGTSAGRGVAINATGMVTLAGADAAGNDSVIQAQVGADATGSGGSVTISASALQATDGARVSTITYGQGNGGSVGVVVAGQAIFSGADANTNDSGIFANSNASGSAGSITLSAASLQVLGGAEVSSSTFGTGKGNSITINIAGDATLSAPMPRGSTPASMHVPIPAALVATPARPR